MQDTFRKVTRTAKKWTAVLALAATAGTVNISASHADEANAKSLLKAMSDYLAAQKTISFDYDTNFEIVTTQQEKVGLASSGTVTISRPDKLHATRTGGFANIEMVFDGKALTLLGKNKNLSDYALSSAIKLWYETGTWGCFCGFERWRATRCNFKKGSARPSLLFSTEPRIGAGRR